MWLFFQALKFLNDYNVFLWCSSKNQDGNHLVGDSNNPDTIQPEPFSRRWNPKDYEFSAFQKGITLLLFNEGFVLSPFLPLLPRPELFQKSKKQPACLKLYSFLFYIKEMWIGATHMFLLMMLVPSERCYIKIRKNVFVTHSCVYAILSKHHFSVSSNFSFWSSLLACGC